MELDRGALDAAINKGWISENKHPTEDLYIYNYTRQTQLDWDWNPITITCRGLILDGQQKVVARPFTKFFTLDQYKDLRNYVHNLYGVSYKDMLDGPFTVTEKMDGSLGIMYKIGDEIAIATRGSFSSDQAIRGTQMIQQYNDYPFAQGITYLFEIIYPENRIVVNYGNRQDVVLIACIDNKTGKDSDGYFYEWKNQGLPCTQNPRFGSFEEVLRTNLDNAEGYVVRFDNGMRVKIKFSEYVRLHYILSGVSTKAVWEALRNNSINELLKDLPDEYDGWVRNLCIGLHCEFAEIENEALIILNNLLYESRTRKEMAEILKGNKYRAIVFLMLDKREYSDIIWDMVQPKFEKPVLVESCNVETK